MERHIVFCFYSCNFIIQVKHKMCQRLVRSLVSVCLSDCVPSDYIWDTIAHNVLAKLFHFVLLKLMR